FVGPPIERLLRTVYSRDESLQLLLTFALVLMFQDVLRFVWGPNPRSLDSAYLVYGVLNARGFNVPVYNLLAIAAAIATAARLRALAGVVCCALPRALPAESRAAGEALGAGVRRL